MRGRLLAFWLLASGFRRSFGPNGKHSVHHAVPKNLTNNSLFCSDSTKQLRESSELWGPVSCHHSGRFAVAVKVPSVSSPFCSPLSRNRHLTSWFCTGPILVTGDSAGFLLLTTRPTREDKYLRALEVRGRDLGTAHRRENGSSR